MPGKWRLTCILDFFTMKTFSQLLLAQKLISSKCVGLLFKNNLLQGDTVPLNKGWERVKYEKFGCHAMQANALFTLDTNHDSRQCRFCEPCLVNRVFEIGDTVFDTNISLEMAPELEWHEILGNLRLRDLVQLLGCVIWQHRPPVLTSCTREPSYESRLMESRAFPYVTELLFMQHTNHDW